MSKVIRPDFNPSAMTWDEVRKSDLPVGGEESEEAAYLRDDEDIEIIEDGVAIIVRLDSHGRVIARRPYGPPPQAEVLPFSPPLGGDGDR